MVDVVDVVDVVAGSPADRAGSSPATWCWRQGLLRAGSRGLGAGLQRLPFAEAIGRPLPVTVVPRGAMVDVIPVPDELTG